MAVTSGEVSEFARVVGASLPVTAPRMRVHVSGESEVKGDSRLEVVVKVAAVEDVSAISASLSILEHGINPRGRSALPGHDRDPTDPLQRPLTHTS